MKHQVLFSSKDRSYEINKIHMSSAATLLVSFKVNTL